MMKALEAEKVQVLTPQETRTTQVLKAYIKLKGTPLPVLLDTGASVSAISKDLAQKLQLKVEANDEMRVSPLGGNPKVKVIGLVQEAPLSVQHIRTPGTLYVVEGTETILILGTDWFDKYQEDISKGDWDIGNCNLVEHEIHLEHDRPIKSPVRYINPRLADWLKGELQKMKEIRVIRKSCSPYASPITIVEVLRSDGKWKIRLCSDTTELNKVTIKDA